MASHPKWLPLHPHITPEHLGLLPGMLLIDDQRSARAQFDQNYKHGGGWHSISGFELNHDTMVLKYPGDPPMHPLALTTLRDETIFLYPHELVLILQQSGSFEVSRMD